MRFALGRWAPLVGTPLSPFIGVAAFAGLCALQRLAALQRGVQQFR